MVEKNSWTKENFLVFIRKIDDEYKKRGRGSKLKIFREVAEEYNLSVNSVKIYYYMFWDHMRRGVPFSMGFGFDEIIPGVDKR